MRSGWLGGLVGVAKNLLFEFFSFFLYFGLFWCEAVRMLKTNMSCYLQLGSGFGARTAVAMNGCVLGVFTNRTIGREPMILSFLMLGDPNGINPLF
jgi:hypothetical protein